jgi:hypothetical protein
MDIRDVANSGNRAALIQAQQPVHVLTFASGFADLVIAGVFTATEVRAWMLNGTVPKDSIAKIAEGNGESPS